jgi:galactokinase
LYAETPHQIRRNRSPVADSEGILRESAVVDVDTVHTTFADLFDGAKPEVLVRSPGRVNLIGEHTDYNGGFVLPIAMSQALYVAARKTNDRRLVVHTTAYTETAEVDLNKVGDPGSPKWANYVRGVAALLQDDGVDLPGAELLIDSQVPLGGGVSSSAALEVGTAKALLTIAGARMDPVPLALLCRRAEHEYAGSPCGIMDQFICVLGQEGHALLLDCRDQHYEQIPVDLPGMVWVVMDTQVKHEIGQSQYPVRQRQCQAGLEHIQSIDAGITSLRDVTGESLGRFVDGMDPVAARRCRHVVNETERTVQAADALRQGDAATFGKLMADSHASLRDDYEVSCDELDALVAVAGAADGVSGARMTGGGFGGCAIALANERAVDALRQSVRERYDRHQAKPALVYTTTASAGAEVQVL